MLSDRLQRYYDPLRLPLDHPPLPVTGYRRACFPPPQDGAEEALSSSQDTLPTVPQSLRREVPRHPLQDPRCLPWPSPKNHGLGSSLFPLTRAFLTTLQLSLNVTDRSVARPQKGLCHSASTTRISPAAGSQLPGTLASPQTGLTPAGCPELDARLHRTLLSLQRPSYWTHGLSETGLWVIRRSACRSNNKGRPLGRIERSSSRIFRSRRGRCAPIVLSG